jgi:aspartate/methionine/tyrosine aminotransferase
MALSRRGQHFVEEAGGQLIWTVIKDLWHPESNPNGYVSLGVAENSLMHEELSKYINDHVKLSLKGLTYGDGGAGSRELQASMARFLTRKLKPIIPFEASHITITNGVSTAIEHVSSIFADPGDVFLLGQPHYTAFIHDIELRPGVEVVRVPFGSTDPLSLEAVQAYKSVIEACHAKGQKVAGLMLCNPHNPLGRCYPREVIVELMKLCEKHKIHLVSDEIYANSVWRNDDQEDASVIPFTSLSSISTDGIIDPALTHILYGVSKDFGANGLRIGCIVSQHNDELRKAIVALAIYSYASSLAESIVAQLLSDDKYVDWYIAENNSRLKANYDLVTNWARKHNVM